MTNEKPTQSTAGNNVLSAVEYDAVLSHLRVLSIATMADYKEVRKIWQCIGDKAGIFLVLTDIADALEATAELKLVSGLEHEATRATQALMRLFGVIP